MKRTIMFIALYSAAFMFPSIGSVNTAGAQTEHCAAFSGPPKAACEAAASAPAPVVGDISHCAAFSGAPQVACEAAAQGAPAAFDDGLMGAPAMAPGYAPGTQGHAPTGGYSPGGPAMGTTGTQGHAPTDAYAPGGPAMGTTGNMNQGDSCMELPAGPNRDRCINEI
jgi:hypothetical protein